MANSNKFSEEYRSIMNALADSVIEASDEELDAEFGTEPPARTKSVLQAAGKEYAQAKLRAARTSHEQATRAIQSHAFDMPASAAERRALLDAVLASHMSTGFTSLTAQFRDLTSIPDADVASTLRQLEALGVLREFREKNK